MPVKKRLLKYLKIALISLSFFFCIVMITVMFTPVSAWLHKYFWINTPIPSKNNDAIIICSSNFHFETGNGLPDLSTLVRMEKGIRLYREGYAPKIIAFGGIWMKEARKTTGQAIKERLLLYGIPEKDIIVQDQIKGKLYYYENILDMMERYKGKIDFDKAVFVTSIDQSFRLYHSLRGLIKKPIVVTGEPYELVADWGRRPQTFRRMANEILFAFPYFYFTGRFSVPSTFVWDKNDPKYKKEQELELYEAILGKKN